MHAAIHTLHTVDRVIFIFVFPEESEPHRPGLSLSSPVYHRSNAVATPRSPPTTTDLTPSTFVLHTSPASGLLDAAGQVFEWTRNETKPGRYEVRGGSWDDKGCGVCRPAARHGRPATLKHILIGFRLVIE